MSYFDQPQLLMYTFNFLPVTDLMNIHAVNQSFNQLSGSDIVWRPRLAQLRQIQSVTKHTDTIDELNQQLQNQPIVRLQSNQSINESNNQSKNQSNPAFDHSLDVIARECLRSFVIARAWPTTQIKLAQATIVPASQSIKSSIRHSSETDEKSSNQLGDEQDDRSFYRSTSQSASTDRALFHCQFSFITWRRHHFEEDDGLTPTMDYTEFIEFEISPNDPLNTSSKKSDASGDTMVDDEKKSEADSSVDQSSTVHEPVDSLTVESEDDEDELHDHLVNRMIDKSNLPFRVSRIGASGSGWRADVVEPNLAIDDHGNITGVIDHSSQSTSQSTNQSAKTAQSIYLSALKCSCSSVYPCSTILRPYPRLPPPGLTPRQISEIHLAEMRVRLIMRQAAERGIPIDIQRLRNSILIPHQPPPGQSITARPVCKSCLKRVALAIESFAVTSVWWHHTQLSVTRLIRINDVEWDVRFKGYEDEVEMCRVVLEPLGDEERQTEQAVRAQYEETKQTSIDGFEVLPVNVLSASGAATAHPVVIVPKAVNQSPDKSDVNHSNDIVNHPIDVSDQSGDLIHSIDVDENLDQSNNQSNHISDQSTHVDQPENKSKIKSAESNLTETKVDEDDRPPDSDGDDWMSDASDEADTSVREEIAAIHEDENDENERIRSAVRAAAASPMCDGWRFRRMHQGGSGRFALSGSDNLTYDSPCPPANDQSVMFEAHEHPLLFYSQAPYRHGAGFGCDVCGEHGNANLWHCSDCQYDVCSGCFRRHTGQLDQDMEEVNDSGQEDENDEKSEEDDDEVINDVELNDDGGL